MFRKILSVLLAATLLVITFTAASHAGKADDTLNFAFKEELKAMDNYFTTDRVTIVMGRLLFDSLLYRDPETFEYKPLLATSYKFVDERTMEFELRRGVKYHNGEEFDADDVVYTFNFVSDPANKVKTQRNVNWIERAEKLGKYKVRLITKKPFPAALEYLAGPLPIYPNEYYAKVGPDAFGANPIGTGPYRVTEVALGRKVVLVKNENYFEGSPKGKPSIGKIVQHTIPDKNTQIAGLLSGRLDWLWKVEPDQADKLKNMPKLVVKNGETMRIGYLQFDAANRTGTNPPVANLKVRQAIAHAIDRQTIVDTLVRGASRVMHGACFPSQFGCAQDVTRYEFSPEKAKKLLAEAGYPDGCQVDFFAYRNRPFAEAIMGYLNAAGIKTKLNWMKYTACRDKVRAGKVEMNFMTWGSYSINDTSAITGNFFKGGSDDTSRDPELARMLDVADNSIDPAVRKEHYKKSLQRIADQVYWLPLWSYNYNYAFTKDLDFTPRPDEIPRFFNAKWR